VQHAAQLLLLPVRLGRHAAEHDGLPSAPPTWATKTSKERTR
jgi:hypothetical protein